MVAIADNGDGDRALQLCDEVADDLTLQFSAPADGLNLTRVENWFGTWGLHRVQVILVDGTRVEELDRFWRARAGAGFPTIEAGAAGAVIDLLIAHNQHLLSALVRARRGVEALRETAALIDAIHPGLYRTLRDESDFHRGLQYLTALS